MAVRITLPLCWGLGSLCIFLVRLSVFVVDVVIVKLDYVCAYFLNVVAVSTTTLGWLLYLIVVKVNLLFLS